MKLRIIFTFVLLVILLLTSCARNESILNAYFSFLKESLDLIEKEELRGINANDEIVLYFARSPNNKFGDLISFPPKDVADFFNAKGIKNVNHRGLVIIFAFHKYLNGIDYNIESIHKKVIEFYPGYMERRDKEYNDTN